MKRLLPFVFVLWASSVGAQTFITTTTLASAVTATQSSIIVTSAAGAWTIGNYAYVDYEVLKITNVSGTLIGVARQQFGTKANAHASGTTILAGNGGHFRNMATYQHSPPVGACVRSSQPYLPIIDYTSGNIWTCNSSSAKWIGTNTAALVYNSIMNTF